MTYAGLTEAEIDRAVERCRKLGTPQGRNPLPGRAEMPRAQKTKTDMIMPRPPLDPPVADQAPTAGDLTAYDGEHLVTYLRLLDADTEGADWKWRKLCCILIRPMNPSGRDAPGRATWRAPSG